MNHIADYIDIISYIISIASVIVKLTPNTVDDQFVSKVLNILELIALNKKK